MDDEGSPTPTPPTGERTRPTDVSNSTGAGERSEGSGTTLAPSARSPLIPKQACWISIYHALILVIGLLITTYFLGPDSLVDCPVPAPPDAAAGATPTPLTQACNTNSLYVLIFALCFGVIGSTLNASRYVVLAVRHARYNQNRILWQLLTPLHGGVLAVVAIYVVVGGLFSLVQGSNVDQEYGYFVGGFSFLVGFSSELFVKRLMSATEALFGEGAPANKRSESVETLGSANETTDESRP